MVHLIFAGLFSLAAIATSILAVRGQARAPVATSPLLPVSLMCAIAVAIMAKAPPSFYYKGSVVLALLVVLIATALFLIKGTPQIVRLGANVIVYFVLWLGFLVTAGRAFWSWPGLLAFLVGFAAFGALFFLVRAKIAWLSLSLLLYTINAAFVVGSVAALLVLQPALWSALAFVGVLLYVGVDVIAASVTWRGPVRNAPPFQALLLSIGGLLLAISVWGDALLHLWPTG